MSRTYEGILRGNRIDWTAERPSPAEPVRVHVTVIDDAPVEPRRGERMAAALSALADQGGIRYEKDPSQWQRETRRERELPGRRE